MQTHANQSDLRPSTRDLELQVLDAEAAVEALLSTPSLRPASLDHLVTLAEKLKAALDEAQTGSTADSTDAARLRELYQQMLDLFRRSSGDSQM